MGLGHFNHMIIAELLWLCLMHKLSNLKLSSSMIKKVYLTWFLFPLLELAPSYQILYVDIQFSYYLMLGLLDVHKVLVSGLAVWGAVLKANRVNALLAFFWLSSDNWSFKVPHPSVAFLPPKNRMCVTWSSSGVWVMVKYCMSLSAMKVQAASLSSAFQSMCGGISVGIAGIPAMTPHYCVCHFTSGGCSGPAMRNACQGQLSGFVVVMLVGLYCTLL